MQLFTGILYAFVNDIGFEYVARETHHETYVARETCWDGYLSYLPTLHNARMVVIVLKY